MTNLLSGALRLLGAPDFWHALLFGGKPGGGVAARSAGANLASKYFTWLSFDGYSDIHDPVAAEIGHRLRKLFLRTAILMTAGAVRFLTGYLLHRITI